MFPFPIGAAPAHAITDLAGRFLSVDDRFCTLLRRERPAIVGRTILDVTADPFRPLNADKLHALREEGKPFVIRKAYLCGDGTLQPVENAVSLLPDDSRGAVLAASVRALPGTPGERFARSVAVARVLLAEQRARSALGRPHQGDDWRLLLAAYLAEADGRVVWTDELCAAAGGDERAGLLRIWELVAAGSLVLEGTPIALDRASVRVSAAQTELIDRHLLGLTDGLLPGPERSG